VDATVLDCDGPCWRPVSSTSTPTCGQPAEDQETVESGCRAAALGGFTAVCPMANTDPVADNAAVIHEVLELARAAGTCDVFPVGAITRGLGGEEMAELGEMVDAGVRLFSDDGRCVPSARVLRNALTYVRAFEGVVIAEHCEDASLGEGGQMHEGLISSSLGLAAQPREAEEVVVARDLAVARLTGGRLHLCHLSSAGSVEMVRRAKAEGLRVTAEVTPHHLVFSEEDLLTYDTNMKMNCRCAARTAASSGPRSPTGRSTPSRPTTPPRRRGEGRSSSGAVRRRARDRVGGRPHHPVEPGEPRCPARSRPRPPRPRGSSAPATTAG
jgi:dihydroorotase